VEEAEMTMRQLVRQLEEAAPAPGSKEWLAGVKKWWGQWVKDAARISKIRDSKDRKVVLAWFADGEDRINRLIDVLVRQSGLRTEPALARVTVGHHEYKDGVRRMTMPRTYAIGDQKYRPEPGELVHPHLHSAYDSLYNVQVQERAHWDVAQGSESQRRWGTTKDLDEWQSYVEMLPHDIKGIDVDVQAALRKYAADEKDSSWRERNVANAKPLEYELNGVKVITDPGSLHDLAMLTGPDAESSGLGVGSRVMEKVHDGLVQGMRALKSSGFGKVWYGQIFVLPPSRSVHGVKKKSGQSFMAGGHYNWNDTVVVNPRTRWTSEYVAGLIVHELGHRYWYKFMKEGARARFAAWFDPRSKDAQEKEGPKSDFVPAPTPYGAENPVEEFAEVFAAYVLGKYEGITLTGPQKARFEALALGRAAQSESRLAILSRMIEDDCQ
jgi:hypothetical protein